MVLIEVTKCEVCHLSQDQLITSCPHLNSKEVQTKFPEGHLSLWLWPTHSQTLILTTHQSTAPYKCPKNPALLAEVTLGQLDLQRSRRSPTGKVSQQQRSLPRDPLANNILLLSDLISWSITHHSSLPSLLLHISHWARAATNTSHDLTLPKSMLLFQPSSPICIFTSLSQVLPPNPRGNLESSLFAMEHCHRRISGCWIPSVPAKGGHSGVGLIPAKLKFPCFRLAPC